MDLLIALLEVLDELLFEMLAELLTNLLVYMGSSFYGAQTCHDNHSPEGTAESSPARSAGLRSVMTVTVPEGRLSRYCDAMTHTYVCNRVHVVFSTKGRRQLIRDPLKTDLWAYIGGIARNNGMRALAVGGTDDHVHLLLSLSAVMPIAKAVQLIKSGSSKWVRDGGQRMFAWQENYSAFSVSASQTPRVVAYIDSQEEHHQKHTFDAELAALLAKHGIEPKE